jgi:hypothetical protein
LHLGGHGQHVGEQSIVRQHGVIDLFGVDVSLRLVEDAGQVAEDVDESWNARLIHGNVHMNP